MAPVYTCLRYRRQQFFLSQEELSEKSNVKQQTISSIEQGRVKRPQPRNIRALADALGIKPQELFTDDPELADGPEQSENIASNRYSNRVA